jgi:hypothetical protein
MARPARRSRGRRAVLGRRQRRSFAQHRVRVPLAPQGLAGPASTTARPACRGKPAPGVHDQTPARPCLANGHRPAWPHPTPDRCGRPERCTVGRSA